MPLRSAAAFRSSRRSSEDRAEVFAHAGTSVIVVADGAGGKTGGAAAADAVVDAVRSKLASGVDVHDLGEWSKLLEETDQALVRSCGGETTAIIVIVSERGVVGVSAGDSQAWCVSERAIDVLTEGQRRFRVGSGRATAVVFERRKLEGVLVVGTDGLFNYASADAIASACGTQEPIEALAAALSELPNQRIEGRASYPDDVAVVAVAGDDA